MMKIRSHPKQTFLLLNQQVLLSYHQESYPDKSRHTLSFAQMPPTTPAGTSIRVYNHVLCKR